MRTELLQDKFRGLMIGAAVGDCIGRPVEGHREVPDSYIDDVVKRGPFLAYTDDTAMSMALAESLLECDGFSGVDMAMKFAREFEAEPFRGYGAGVSKLLDRVLRGAPWDQASQRQFGGDGSYGNGGAMRVSPVALWAYPDRDKTIDLAQETAKVTHTHPLGVEGAVIQAVAAHHALMAEDPAVFDPSGLLSDLDDIVENDEYRRKLDVMTGCVQTRNDDRARLHLGNWVAAQNSVVTALYCFLASDTFEDALRRAIRMGGDTDTIGAMAGALAGARWGYSQIPETWLNIEGHDMLLDLADALFDRIP